MECPLTLLSIGHTSGVTLWMMISHRISSFRALEVFHIYQHPWWIMRGMFISIYTLGYINMPFFFVRSCVRVVSSTRAGMGKTLFVTRMAEKLQSLVVHDVHVIIPVHGPLVTTDSVVQYLVNHQSTSHCTILHFDISPSVRELFTACRCATSVSNVTL